MSYKYTTNIQVPMQIAGMEQSTIDRLIDELERRKADLIEQTSQFLNVTFNDTPESQADHCVSVCKSAYAMVVG